MKHIKYIAEIQTQKTHKTRETQIYVVHPVWSTSMEKQPLILFILSSKLKRYNLQEIHCNSLFALNILSLPHSKYRYIDAIQFPHI